jgi:hypothetical protein
MIVSHIQCRFVDRDMMMRYHHFLGIGHTYSKTFRPSPHSASAQESAGTYEGSRDQDQEMSDLPPTPQVQIEELSDADSINTIDNGWREWDDGGDEGDDGSGNDSDGDLLDMDDMYGS